MENSVTVNDISVMVADSGHLHVLALGSSQRKSVQCNYHSYSHSAYCTHKLTTNVLIHYTMEWWILNAIPVILLTQHICKVIQSTCNIGNLLYSILGNIAQT